MAFWAFVSLPIFAILGAYSSWKVKFGANVLWIPLVGILPTISWIVITRYSSYSLSIAGAFYDVLYDVSYFLTLIALGESARWWQWIGVAIAMGGLGLMGYNPSSQ